MAGSVVGALRVNLGLDSAQFTNGTRRVQQNLNRMRNQFLAVAGTVSALGAAMGAMARRGAADIDRVVKAARRIDGSTTAFQALELAASEAGVSLSSLTNDIQTMNRELSRNSTGAQRALSQLGLSASELLALDADERVAAIADRIDELGLSAGDATALLRDLGIRNREMALLMVQGGDAIREAREDVRAYGLEIDDALGARVENARDQIGRLGVVTQYFGRRLAAETIPALGAFAQAITDSMREGGLLRALIDGLVDNLQLLTTIAATAVLAFGVRYVAALGLAATATGGLSGALVLLRTALMRTGIGALIVGAGVLIDFLIRLRTATGSWGEALSALGDLAAGVWEGIKTSAGSIWPALQAVWNDVQAGFMSMIEAIQRRWADFLHSIADGLRGVPGMDAALLSVHGAAVRAGSALGETQGTIDGLRSSSEALRREAADNLTKGFDQAREAAARLGEIVKDTGDDVTDAADDARGLNDELDRLAGDGAGGAAAAVGELTEAQRRALSVIAQMNVDAVTQAEVISALREMYRSGAIDADQLANAIERVKEQMSDVDETSFDLGQSLAGVFRDAVTGAKRLDEGLRDLLKSLSSMFFNQAFQQLFSNIDFSGLAFGGFRADGGPVQSNRAYVVGERGPEMFVPSGAGQIVPNHQMGGGTNVQIINNTGAPVREERSRGPDGREIIRTIIGEEIGSGRMDKPMKRFGMTPSPVRR